MARTPMVTRTIVTTNAKVLCVDLATGETFINDTVLPRTYADDKKMLKACEKAINSEAVKAVHVMSHEEVETLYGMLETEFVKHAVLLDPETRKALETEEA